MRVVDPHSLLVEQPVQQAVRRQVGIDQLLGGRRAHQDHRPPPPVLDIIGDDRIAALGWDALQHQAAGPPSAAGSGAADRQLDPRLNLFGLPEIMVGTFGEGRSGELDDALVAIGVLALIDSEGNVPGADEQRDRWRGRPGTGQRRLELGLVILRVTAQGTLG